MALSLASIATVPHTDTGQTSPSGDVVTLPLGARALDVYLDHDDGGTPAAPVDGSFSIGGAAVGSSKDVPLPAQTWVRVWEALPGAMPTLRTVTIKSSALPAYSAATPSYMVRVN